MPLTTLDPNTALLVIDLQKGIASLPLAHPISVVVERTCELLTAFRVRGLPVILVNVAGQAPGRTEQPPRLGKALPAGFTDLLPELDQQPKDITVTKRSWGAFATTDLAEKLRARGVTQVVVVGVSTGTGVEATARQAYEGGFNVTLAIDAMTDTRAEMHDHSIRQVFPRLGETGTSQEIIAMLNPTKL